MTPIFKCLLLVSLIFSAKVLSLQSENAHGSKNTIHLVKNTNFVRTFTKYHHRREDIINEQQKWPETNEHERKIHKRSVQYFKLDSVDKVSDLNNINQIEKPKKMTYEEELKKYKVKAAIVFKEPPTTKSPPGLKCLYKIHQMTLSATPAEVSNSPGDTIQSENIVPGVVAKSTLPSGETADIEQCTHPRASCYTLWYDGDGNTTVLGQGCWRWSRDQDESSCDKCTRVSPHLPATKFCCCTTDYCNGEFLSIREEQVTSKAESKQALPPRAPYVSDIVGAGVVAALGVLVVCVAAHIVYCSPRGNMGGQADVLEKGEMAKGTDAMATGLFCVDNLTLHEQIGVGKFGTVYVGSLGSTPVAVKMCSTLTAWRRETSIYSTPGIKHHNILDYYGSESRPLLTSEYGREQLLVLELCTCSLRSYLTDRSISWGEFGRFAHGLAAGLAHLHTSTAVKPCIVHRDVNSNNVLIAPDGTVRLADLGLGQVLHANNDPNMTTPYTEAGTVRYLSPESLEGALDLCGPRGALCAVDVYALGLVLWEMLYRTRGAHTGPTPEYTLPYGDVEPTLNNMQTVVSRNKTRPPLPRGHSTYLNIANNTCEECWDHDAEARLTAICVEERMSSLIHMLETPAPLIHHNIHPTHGDSTQDHQPESDKNSNCLSATTTPLLHTHITGRNVCIQRNTHTHSQADDVLVHKSLKDITTPIHPVGQRVDNQESVLSVARENKIRVLNENMQDIRSIKKPIDYVPNDMTMDVKETNLRLEKPRWSIKKFFERKNVKSKLDTQVVLQDSIKTKTVVDKNSRPSNLILNDSVVFNMEGPCLSPPNRTLSPNMFSQNRSEKVFGYKELPNDVDSKNKQIFAVIVPKGVPTQSTSNSDSLKKYKTYNSDSGDSIKKRFSESKIITNSSNSGRSSRASVNLELQYLDSQNSYNDYDINSDCSSLEDEHLMLLSENGGAKITMQIKEKKDILKECPKELSYNKPNKYSNFDNELSNGHDKENYIDNPVYLAINDDKKIAIKRQRSLEQVSEIFSSSGDVRLQNPANRVKTPGDLPVAIRKARRDKFRKSNACNRLSLYDDRIMFGNSL